MTTEQAENVDTTEPVTSVASMSDIELLIGEREPEEGEVVETAPDVPEDDDTTDEPLEDEVFEEIIEEEPELGDEIELSAEEEAPKRDRSAKGRIKELTDAGKAKDEVLSKKDQEIQRLEFELQQMTKTKDSLVNSMTKVEAEEPEEEDIVIDDVLAKKLKKLEDKIEGKEKVDAVTTALTTQHNTGVATHGEDYNTARKILVASEVHTINAELQPMGMDVPQDEITALAQRRVAEREVSLLQMGKSVVDYTWNKASLIAQQMAPKTEDKPKGKPKVNMDAIKTAREQAGTAPVKRASTGGEASTLDSMFAQFENEDQKPSAF